MITASPRESTAQPMPRWYALLTKPRQEQLALQNLQRQAFNGYLPLCRERRLVRGGYRWLSAPLFPRYLFVRLDLSTENTAPIRSTLGCCGLVRFGERTPHIPDVFVETLRAKSEPDGCIPLTSSQWQTGQRVQLAEGPFAGVEAIYQAPSGVDRALVLLKWLGQMRPVVVPESVLAPAM